MVPVLRALPHRGTRAPLHATTARWADHGAWPRSITNMKIVLKGVQTWEDAVKAVEHGVDGILLSNHGGRQLDSARSSIEARTSDSCCCSLCHP